MAKINSYRRRWLRYHKGYEKRAYKVFKAVFKKWSKDIPLDEMTIFNYPEVLDRSIDVEDMFKAYEEVYLNVGLMHGRRLKKEVQEKFFDLDDFPTIFKEFIQNWLRTNAADNIVSIARTFKSEIRQILTQGIQDGRTIQELTTDLNKMLKRPGWYRWQSMRIARTETTTSANLATIKQAELLPYYADKLWISGSDARVRRFPVAKYDHLQMNGKKAGLADYFEVPNTEIGFKGQLLYPGDPIGRAGNIINCRCTIGIVGKRDKNGMLIMKQGESPTISTPLPKPIPKPPKQTGFRPAKTIAEAEKWVLDKGLLNEVNYKGISLDRANLINRQLEKLKNNNIKFYSAKYNKNQDQLFGFNNNELKIGKQINFKDESIQKIIDRQIKQSYQGTKYYNSSSELIHKGYEVNNPETFLKLLLEHEGNHYQHFNMKAASLGGWGKETQRLSKRWYRKWFAEVAKRHGRSSTKWIPSRYSEIYVNDNTAQLEWFAEARLLYKRNPNLIEDEVLRKLLSEFDNIYKLLL